MRKYICRRESGRQQTTRLRSWEPALGHVKLVLDKLECGSCWNMTPETNAGLCAEMERKRGLCHAFYRVRKTRLQ